jgi:hypothetical protein
MIYMARHGPFGSMRVDSGVSRWWVRIRIEEGRTLLDVEMRIRALSLNPPQDSNDGSSRAAQDETRFR